MLKQSMCKPKTVSAAIDITYHNITQCQIPTPCGESSKYFMLGYVPLRMQVSDMAGMAAHALDIHILEFYYNN
jgi:hypothetical protein